MDRSIQNRLYISTIAADAISLAEEYSLGLEIADFCVAANMDESYEPYGRLGEGKMRLKRNMTFHFPFAELCPCAIDPLVREITRHRHEQALSLSLLHGVKKIIAHAGFIPLVYNKEWFVAESIKYWREFLRDKPCDISICLENVMEDSPLMLLRIIEGVRDPRLCLCLDIGHAGHRVSSTPLKDWINTLSPYVAQVHLHNNDRDVDRHWELGRGNIAMEEALCSVIAACPSAGITIECSDAKSSVIWLFEKGFLE